MSAVRQKSSNGLFKIMQFIGNVMSLSGFAYLFGRDFVDPYLPAEIAYYFEQYEQLPFGLIIVGFALTFIPTIIEQLAKLRAPAPSALEQEQERAELARISRILETDPVAQKTQWSPAESGGHSGRSARLVEVNNQRMAVKITKSAIYTAVGSLAMLAIVFVFTVGDRWITPEAEKPYLFTAVLVGMILFTIYSLMTLAKPRTFDKTNGWYWCGFGLGNDTNKIKTHRKSVPLHDIHALQVMTEQVSKSNGHYNSYELNLVLKDGTRRNVVDHSDFSTLMGDARVLAGFLNVDIWQKSDEEGED